MPTPDTAPALYRGGKFADDEWRFAADEAALPEAVPAIVSKKRYLAERETLRARGNRLGLVLETNDTLDGIEDELAGFDLIVLRFARYANGRPYSLAQRIRRLGYRGELRAAGDVLQDQVVFMLRAGFDSLSITHQGTIDALRENRIVVVPTRAREAKFPFARAAE
jgi:uncharacterized protein (DUF934 family)